MNNRVQVFWYIAAIAVVLLVGVLAGRYLFSAPQYRHADVSSSETKQAKTVWSCSMHPQVRQSKPGKCPICFMDLIPLKHNPADAENSNSTELKLSPRAEKLAEIQTERVRRKVVAVKVGMVGKVDFDESQINYITARMPGRIDKLFIDYTGIAVKKGDHMAEYFSADLMVAQKELLMVMKDRAGKTPEELAAQPEYETRMLESVLKKFELWGLTKENIDRIIRSGKVNDHLTLYAPVAGIVIQKNALEGKYFKTGERLFTIADLNKVWIKMDAYETDLPWLRYGQQVKFTTIAYPDEVFTGRISFISPVMDENTRTIKIRVNAPNLQGKLKPGMFVNAVVDAKISQSGRVIDPSLNDKWISPMHPEIIKDQPGKCDICGMKLVKAEALGYDRIDQASEPLVIPVTAPLITGKRAVVYLKSPTKPGVYYGKEVVLGPRAGKYYIVKSGLKAGDLVVVNGNFKIDSALQIAAKPSMMSAAVPKKPHKQHTRKLPVLKTVVPNSFKQQLAPLYAAYFKIRQKLAADKFSAVAEQAKTLAKLTDTINVDQLSGDAVRIWDGLKKNITAAAEEISIARNITDARSGFSHLSAEIFILAKKIGTAGKLPIYRFHCPMAFDNKGGYWLQNSQEIDNPYFGAVMLKCGEKTENITE
jgi:membrane fusion protein, copper/silver efflux system